MSAPRLAIGLLCGLVMSVGATAQRAPRVSNGRSIHMEARSAPTVGRICVIAFNDRNGDGARNSGEPTLAGRRFLILGGANVTMAQGRTDASGEYCSTGLAPGAYSLRESGSVAARAVTVTGPETVRVALGGR